MLEQREKRSTSPAVADKAVVSQPTLSWRRPELHEAALPDLTMSNTAVTTDVPLDN